MVVSVAESLAEDDEGVEREEHLREYLMGNKVNLIDSPCSITQLCQMCMM